MDVARAYWRVARLDGAYFALAFVIGALSSYFASLVPKYLAQLTYEYDGVALDRLALSQAAAAVAAGLRGYMFTRLISRVHRRATAAALYSARALPVEAFEDREACETLTLRLDRFAHDLTTSANVIARCGVSAAVLACLTFAQSPALAVATLAIAAARLLAFRRLQERHGRSEQTVARCVEKLHALSREYVAKVGTLRVFDREDWFFEEHSRVYAELESARACESKSYSAFVSASQFAERAATVATVALAFGSGGNAKVAYLLGYQIMLFDQASQIVDAWRSIRSALPACAPVSRLLAAAQAASRAPPAALPRDASIEFSDVSFAYPSRPISPVLTLASFRVASGSTCGLRGRSGCGKSTILKLAAGFLAPTGGIVRVGDVDATECLRRARGFAAIVPQEPVIFESRSMLENVALGRACENAARRAIEAVGLSEWADSLPGGRIEPGALSGGQRQRIAVARALALSYDHKNAPRIVFMDEPTSALDEASSARTRRAMREAFFDDDRVTVLLVTHSDALLEECDAIVDVERLNRWNDF